MFTVVTDQHSAAIIVQTVDDAGYSLGGLPTQVNPGYATSTDPDYFCGLILIIVGTSKVQN